jgi:hypothetical protein
LSAIFLILILTSSSCFSTVGQRPKNRCFNSIWMKYSPIPAKQRIYIYRVTSLLRTPLRLKTAVLNWEVSWLQRLNEEKLQIWDWLLVS